MAPLRIVFMGTPQLAGVSLLALLHSTRFQVAAAVTQPDQPQGRGLKLQPSPVKEIAQREQLPVLQPQRARDESFLQDLKPLQPDLIVVVAYGQILPPGILELPRFGCLNVHTSLLPKYRGAAPIQWAILNDESETGVTLMKMDAGLDTGDIVAQERTPIQPDDTAETLHDRLGEMGAALLVNSLEAYVAGRLRPQPQPAEGVSQAPKIRKTDGRIDWQQPARAVWNRVRAMVPWPGAFTHLPAQPQPRLLKIWQAAPDESSGQPGQVLCADKNGIVIGCGAGALRVLVLQREGGRRLKAQEFLAGQPLSAGQGFVGQ
jgi:methionyl-tRNA formyltransferase